MAVCLLSLSNGVMEQVLKKIPKERLYLETGIQFQKFNTIYQLFSIKQNNPDILEQTSSLLMIPDYFHFLLTGKKASEYTNSTSTQLVNAFTKKWDDKLLDKLNINSQIFQEIKSPMTILGTLKKELVQELGFNLQVVLPATHDTASAVIAVPEEDDTIYISSGTWSLIGIENYFPICIPKALEYNFTNEGGIEYQYRFLKNIMGLWMIQEVRRNYENKYSFAELVELAKDAKDFQAVVNVNDDRFLKPNNMIDEIIKYCLETNQPIPDTPGKVAKCIYESLVESYKEAVSELEEILEREYKSINIIGGGSLNDFLNQQLADKTNKEVFAGPAVATAIGNIVSQLIALKEISDVKEARSIVKASFNIKKFQPALTRK